MDIFSHGLWAGAAAMGANKIIAKHPDKKPLNVWLAMFWGVFPDLFAFTISFVWLLGNLIFNRQGLADFPGPDNTEPMSLANHPMLALTNTLYNISHSLIIFFLIFIIAALIYRYLLLPAGKTSGRNWEMGAWLLHILIDIPTHNYNFYPTPIFWPLSGWKFNGFNWGNGYFLIANYSLLLIIFLLLRKKRNRLKIAN